MLIPKGFKSRHSVSVVFKGVKSQILVSVHSREVSDVALRPAALAPFLESTLGRRDAHPGRMCRAGWEGASHVTYYHRLTIKSMGNSGSIRTDCGKARRRAESVKSPGRKNGAVGQSARSKPPTGKGLGESKVTRIKPGHQLRSTAKVGRRIQAHASECKSVRVLQSIELVFALLPR